MKAHQLSDVPFPMNTNANTHQSAIAVPIVAPIHLALDVFRFRNFSFLILTSHLAVVSTA